MAKQELTKYAVENLAASDQDCVIWDTALPGFGIRVKPSNVKSYIVQYRNRKSGFAAENHRSARAIAHVSQSQRTRTHYSR